MLLDGITSVSVQSDSPSEVKRGLKRFSDDTSVICNESKRPHMGAADLKIVPQNLLSDITPLTKRKAFAIDIIGYFNNLAGGNRLTTGQFIDDRHRRLKSAKKNQITAKELSFLIRPIIQFTVVPVWFHSVLVEEYVRSLRDIQVTPDLLGRLREAEKIHPYTPKNL